MSNVDKVSDLSSVGFTNADKMVNLTKYLSSRGIASRRKVVELIKNGRISVNGSIVNTPGVRVGASDVVMVDNELVVPPPPRRRYLMLNKPRGYICSHSDRHAARLAVSLINLDPPVRLAAAGRLDCDSEGLLIFSNDGEYLDRIAHPRYEVCKRYEVELARELSPEAMEAAQKGVIDSGETLRVLQIRALGNRRYEIILNEGKKREIRRITAALGAPTRQLRRVAVGALQLGTLAPGEWRELTPEELELSLRPGIQK